MYQKVLLIFLSLFLLILSSVSENTGRAMKHTEARKSECPDSLFPVSTGKRFSTLVHEASNCEK